MKRIRPGLYAGEYTNNSDGTTVKMTVFQGFGNNDKPKPGEWLYQAEDDADAHGGCPAPSYSEASNQAKYYAENRTFNKKWGWVVEN